LILFGEGFELLLEPLRQDISVYVFARFAKPSKEGLILHHYFFLKDDNIEKRVLKMKRFAELYEFFHFVISFILKAIGHNNSDCFIEILSAYKLLIIPKIK
jgi:hypothetical protein